jgi:hypothetical protein
MNETKLQAMMNGMCAQWQRERADTQMTLGKLIERLESLPAETMLEGICKPHSYRGYYSDLAFERGDKVTAAKALETCRGCMGEVFQGYKGGDFQMGRNTPVWLASHGRCGLKIMDILEDGTLELKEDV